MDENKISTIKKEDDWANSSRYRINYDGTILVVYAYDTNEIASIRNTSMECVYNNNNSQSIDYVAENKEIILKDGELGKYGKYVTLDGEQYIRYYIPAGTYEVKALTKNSKLFVVTKEVIKNSSGYDEATTTNTVNLLNVDDTDLITITDNECISLVMNSNFSLIEK